MIESRNGFNRTNAVQYAPYGARGSWTVATGTGAVQRVETRDVAFVFGSATNRFETQQHLLRRQHQRLQVC